MIKQLIQVFTVAIFFLHCVEASEHPVDESIDDMLSELDCIIEPSVIADVGSPARGVVEKIYSHRSDLVKKGKIIIQMESSVERASLELARIRADLNTAIELRQESARFGILSQERNQELLRKSVISVYDMDKTKTETRIAELQVRQEQDNQNIAKLEYLRAKAVLQQRSIRSPVEGVVMERFKSVGEFVDDEPLIRIAQLDPLHVEVIVPVAYLDRITLGMQANVAPSMATNKKYLATVERIDRVADAASGTYGIRLSLPNPEYKIPAGLRCLVSFLPPQEEATAELADNTKSAKSNQ